MFDLMIKILPNGRVLIRNIAEKTSESLKATQVSGYIEKLFVWVIKAQEEQDAKIAGIKKGAEHV